MLKKKDAPELYEVLKTAPILNKEGEPQATPEAEAKKEQPPAQVTPLQSQQAATLAPAAPPAQQSPKTILPSTPLSQRYISVSLQYAIVAVVLICISLVVSFSLGITLEKNKHKEIPPYENGTYIASEYGEKEPSLQGTDTRQFPFRLRLYFQPNDSAGQGYHNVKTLYERIKNSGLPGTLRVVPENINVFLVTEFTAKSQDDADRVRDKFKNYSIDGIYYFRDCKFY